MIDIHSHILFDIDDGAKTPEESVELCRGAYEGGYKIITATPHFSDYRSISSFVCERNAKIQELRDMLLEENIPIKIAAGAELYLSDRIYYADNLDALTLNGSRYMLCEMPLGPFDVSRAPQWMDELISRGYVPVLAHPERYIEFHRTPFIIDEFLDRGVIFQVNIDSLIGRNGEAPQMMAVDMVTRKIAMLIGSDAHDTLYRHTRLREKLKELPAEITDEMLVECMHNFPKIILNNEEI